MNYQLPQPAQKAAYVQQKFDEIAPQYDRFNDLITAGLHRYWKHFVVRQTGVSEQGTCLDLCCGTGDIALRLAQAIPQGQVVALDFSAQMLEVAAQRFRRAGAGIALMQGDALRLPFAEASFDALTVGYGLRNFSDLEAGLREIWRVLKPGGVMVSLDVGKVRWPWLEVLNRFYFFRIVPWIGKQLDPGQEMFDYLPHSSVNYPNQETLKRQLLNLGFQQVDIHDFLWGASAVHVAYKPVRSLLENR